MKNELIRMGALCEETIRMVTESVASYVRQDTDQARLVITHDDVVDRYFTQVRKVLIRNVVEEPSSGEHVLDLLMIDEYLEIAHSDARKVSSFIISRIIICTSDIYFPWRERCDIMKTITQVVEKRKRRATGDSRICISAEKQPNDKGEEHVLDSLPGMWKFDF